jgi:hypothetical protein
MIVTSRRADMEFSVFIKIYTKKSAITAVDSVLLFVYSNR